MVADGPAGEPVAAVHSVRRVRRRDQAHGRSDRGVSWGDVTLPPEVQTLADQMVRALNMLDCPPSSLCIHFDDKGLVQKVTPELTFRRKKGIDNARMSSVDLTR